ncbi:hypothetical protein CLI64_23125 [Nostoc sp. CENA543]|uniref:hypothetical protein n=1 Tax=Nostoc sp. CENA543 TaxID=1869241 RepID=UPI000CA2E472|nr:hypothetical protein [Nostoc sp. CENA543]AUT03064.1 hypothetical protein CLI64_23125 [Nostoc sp. CENA543]
MSRTFWKVLGVLSLLAGISLLMQSPGVFATRSPDKQLEFIIGTAALVGLCGLFAIACWFPQSHKFTLRVIGLFGVVACLFSIYDIFRDRHLNWVAMFSRLALIVGLWLPGSLYLVKKGNMTDL